MKILKTAAGAFAALCVAGCGANYAWRPAAPASARTVAVPTFRNESDSQELGAVAARQLLREFQREGTFRVRAAGDAAVEVQGTAVSAGTSALAYDRRTGMRLAGREMTATFRVSVIDKRAGKVLVDNRLYTARAPFSGAQDSTTSMRDAAGRTCEDLARQVVDDVLNLKWEKSE